MREPTVSEIVDDVRDAIDTDEGTDYWFYYDADEVDDSDLRRQLKAAVRQIQSTIGAVEGVLDPWLRLRTS